MPTTKDAAELEIDEQNAELPPSAKLVLVLLQTNGPQTRAEICDHGRLHPGTASFALDRLEKQGQINSRYSTDDARQKIYTVQREL